MCQKNITNIYAKPKMPCFNEKLTSMSGNISIKRVALKYFKHFTSKP